MKTALAAIAVAMVATPLLTGCAGRTGGQTYSSAASPESGASAVLGCPPGNVRPECETATPTPPPPAGY